MRIYLVRHAEALPRGILPVDDHRHLVPEGRKQSRKVGKILRALGVEWDRILTSPSMRAVQTAEIVAARLKFRGPIEAEGVLLGAAGDWAKYLAAAEKTGAKEVALVGHEPDLGVALGQALGEAPIALPKGSVAALERGADGTWKALGLLRPASSDWEPLGPKPAKVAKPEKAEKPSKSEKHVKLEEVDGAEKQDKPEKSARSEKAAKPEKSGKPSKAEKPKIHETPETPEKAERAEETKLVEKAGRKTQPARNAEFVNAAEQPAVAALKATVRKPKAGGPAAAGGKNGAAATPRSPRKAGTAFANEEAAARPAGKRNGRPKG